MLKNFLELLAVGIFCFLCGVLVMLGDLMTINSGSYTVTSIKQISKTPKYKIILENVPDPSDPTKSFKCTYYTNDEYKIGDTIRL